MSEPVVSAVPLSFEEWIRDALDQNDNAYSLAEWAWNAALEAAKARIDLFQWECDSVLPSETLDAIVAVLDGLKVKEGVPSE